MEPRSNGIVPVERACFASQDDERSLKHIIDIGAIPQDAVANAQHQRPIPLDQCRKRILIVLPCVTFQKLPIRQICSARTASPIAETPEELSQRRVGHVAKFIRSSSDFLYNARKETIWRSFFLA
jgi:hypothetical protein